METAFVQESTDYHFVIGMNLSWQPFSKIAAVNYATKHKFGPMLTYNYIRDFQDRSHIISEHINWNRRCWAMPWCIICQHAIYNKNSMVFTENIPKWKVSIFLEIHLLQEPYKFILPFLVSLLLNVVPCKIIWGLFGLSCSIFHNIMVNNEQMPSFSKVFMTYYLRGKVWSIYEYLHNVCQWHVDKISI